MSSYPICEYVDHDSEAFTFRVRLRGADLPDGTERTLVLRSRTGTVVASATAQVDWRVNTTGVWSRSAFDFRIEHSVIPAGGFRLELKSDRSERRRAVAPSTGVLVESRPRVFAKKRQFQIFPAAGKQATWLRISTLTKGAKFAWKIRNGAR